MKQRILATITLTTVLSLAGFAFVRAQTEAGGSQALEISPPVVNLSAEPGETVKTQIALRDIASTPLLVRGQVNDFVSQGEDGIPKILLEPGEESPYSMKSWFSPLDELTLQPKQIENLTVTINVPANAAPGGYYSVIRFTATAPGMEGSGVSLSASLGALVLMQVKGPVSEKLLVEEFSTQNSFDRKAWLFESTPVKFVLRTKNEGTIHTQPVGQIAVKDMFGNLIANVNMNLERRNVLPGSIRRFEAPLDKAVIGDRLMFGRYTADITTTYGEGGQKITSSLSFWVIPWKAILFIVGGLIGGFLLLRLALRRYNEHILARSPRRRR